MEEQTIYKIYMTDSIAAMIEKLTTCREMLEKNFSMQESTAEWIIRYLNNVLEAPNFIATIHDSINSLTDDQVKSVLQICQNLQIHLVNTEQILNIDLPPVLKFDDILNPLHEVIKQFCERGIHKTLDKESTDEEAVEEQDEEPDDDAQADDQEA